MTASSLRGLNWFNALSGDATPVSGLPPSLKVADGQLDGQPARFIAVVPDPDNRFPRARQGLMNAQRLFAPAIGLARHIDNGDQRPLVLLVLIGADHLIPVSYTHLTLPTKRIV